MRKDGTRSSLIESDQIKSANEKWLAGFKKKKVKGVPPPLISKKKNED